MPGNKLGLFYSYWVCTGHHVASQTTYKHTHKYGDLQNNPEINACNAIFHKQANL